MPTVGWSRALFCALLLFTCLVGSPSLMADAIHDAAKSGDAAEVERLLTAGADVNKKDAGLNTALHWAADKGHLEVVRVLVAKGADVNARDLGDWTPLLRAVVRRHTNTVQFLIANGADVNVRDSDGVAALDDAIRYDQSSMIELLKNAGAKCGTNYVYSRWCKEATDQN